MDHDHKWLGADDPKKATCPRCNRGKGEGQVSYCDDHYREWLGAGGRDEEAFQDMLPEDLIELERLVATANQIVDGLGLNARHAMFVQQVRRANEYLDKRLANLPTKETT